MEKGNCQKTIEKPSYKLPDNNRPDELISMKEIPDTAPPPKEQAQKHFNKWSELGF